VLGLRLLGERRHPVGAGARDRLVGRDPHAGEPRLLVERLEDAGERNRAAVRVRDDAVAPERLERPAAVHLRHDERVSVDEAVGGRLVDADRAGGGCDRDERPAGRGADREEEEVDVARAERVLGRLLDGERVVAVGQARPRGARGREGAHVLVPALGQQAERHRAHCAGGADDSDPRLRAHQTLF
jgi:hypothetical protein